MADKTKHILVLWMENKAGVLNKIASLCRRRQYNIESLTVGTSHLPGISHMTIVMMAEDNRIQQIASQINKIIEIISVEHIRSKDVIDKEMILLIVKDDAVVDRLKENVEPVHKLNIRQLNKTDGHPILEIVGEGIEIEHFLKHLDMEKDVIKMARSGLVALKV